jgi:hypothetical protein
VQPVQQPGLQARADNPVALLVHAEVVHATGPVIYNQCVSDTEKTSRAIGPPHSGGTNCITCKGKGWVCEDRRIADRCDPAKHIEPCPIATIQTRGAQPAATN